MSSLFSSKDFSYVFIVVGVECVTSEYYLLFKLGKILFVGGTNHTGTKVINGNLSVFNSHGYDRSIRSKRK